VFDLVFLCLIVVLSTSSQPNPSLVAARIALFLAAMAARRVRPQTTKVNGNTATRRLSVQEAKPHAGSIDNEMRERHLIRQMCQVAAKIGELLVKEIARAA
jgi:hypothetical protein